jgi:hypothetical protein
MVIEIDCGLSGVYSFFGRRKIDKMLIIAIVAERRETLRTLTFRRACSISDMF